MGQLAEHIVNHPFLVGGLIAAVAAIVFFETRLRTKGRVQLVPVEAVRLINAGAVVIDVRNTEAFRAGHIVNARNVALGELNAEHAALKKVKKNKTVITVCDNGVDSAKAAGLLRKAGFEEVFSLKGGLNGWRSENLPLVKE